MGLFRYGVSTMLIFRESGLLPEAQSERVHRYMTSSKGTKQARNRHERKTTIYPLGPAQYRVVVALPEPAVLANEQMQHSLRIIDDKCFTFILSLVESFNFQTLE